MNTTVTLSRREFIKLSTRAGAGLIIGFYLPWSDTFKVEQLSDSFKPNVWLSIDTSGIITITMHRSEMGQKIWTALPMIVAEELEADWSKVRVKQGDLNPAYGGQTTGGSASIRTSYDKLRRAGATAREMLITAATQIWDVSRRSCRAEKSTIIHVPTSRRLTYAELVETATKLPIPKEILLKDPKDFKVIGQEFKSLDAAPKTDGSAIYGYDFKVPGMLIATVARCPVVGGKVASYDDSKAKTVEGVRHVVQISSGVAIVADNTWAALQGRKALRVIWDKGPNANLSSENISRMLKKAAQSPGTVLRNDGDAQTALAKAAKKLKATYEVPYLDHAPMEPMNCIARVRNGECEIWAPTQNPYAAQRVAMEITGLSEAAVKVHTLLIGSGFGRRLQADYVQDAVEIAKVIDSPVKVIRTREEDIQNGFYRPATYHEVEGGLDGNNRPVTWIHRVSGPRSDWHGLITGGADELAYAIPNVYVDYVMSDIPIPIGPWRSVAHSQNAFVNECFIDELALATGKDPYEFRRKLLKDHPRHLGVLNLAAKKAKWGKQLSNDRYQGLAVHFSYHSYAAVVIEISIEKQDKIKIHKVVCAIDCGTVINPDGVKAQVEGGIVIGLTAALYGAITLKNGKVQQSNFHNYKLLTMREMPEVETYIVPSTEPPTGVGEPPVPPTAPALVNAIFAATGKRIRRLPIHNQGLRKT